MSKRMSKRELDDQFDAFLKESVSSEDSIDSALILKHLEPTGRKAEESNASLWWLDTDDDSQFGTGLSLTGQSFLKSKSPGPQHSTPIAAGQEDDGTTAKTESKLEIGRNKKGIESNIESKGKSRNKKEQASKTRGSRGWAEVSLSKDSLDDISERSDEDYPKTAKSVGLPLKERNGRDSADHTDNKGYGAETLEEMAEKEQFFKDLEGSAGGTVDYNRLNEELGHTATIAPVIDISAVLAGKQTDFQSSGLEKNAVPKPSMLSKVSLLDSLDSTSTSPKAAPRREIAAQENLAQTAQDTLKTVGTGILGTNTSLEMEALQNAYREVGLSSSTLLEIEEDQTEGIVNLTKDDNRTVDDIIKEVEYLEKKRKPPIQPRFQTVDSGESQVIETYDDSRGPPIIPSPRSDKKTVFSDKEPLERKDSKKQLKTNFEHVKSSGYGSATALAAQKDTRLVKGSSQTKLKSTKSNADVDYTKNDASVSSPGVARTASKQGIKTSGVRDMKSVNKDTGLVKKPAVNKDISLSSSEGIKQRTVYDKLKRADMLESVESLVSYLQEQCAHKENIESDVREVAALSSHNNQSIEKLSHLEREKVLLQEVQDLQEQWTEQREAHYTAKVEWESHERELQRQIEAQKIDHEKQLSKIKQHNFLLSAKVSDLETHDSKISKLRLDCVSNYIEPESKERISLLEKEISEQEQLLGGYQQENKRLYDEMKSVKLEQKETEERLFKENQKLLSELSALKSQLELKHVKADNVIHDGHDTAVTIEGLQRQLKVTKTQVSQLEREMTVLRKDKDELEQHVSKLITERERLQRIVDDSRNMKSDEARELESQYASEIDRLNKKLRWYIENQELLDKSTAMLKEKEQSMERMKNRIQELQTEAGQRAEENRIFNKEKAADNKKIQDLQRQVKEMEQIIRRRYPNSLPALMMAAAAATSTSDTGSQGVYKPLSVQALESRINKMETEQEGKDEEAEKMLRSVEQKFNAIKLQYEERIESLEDELATQPKVSHVYESHRHNTAASLQHELDSVREKHRKQVSALQAQVDKLLSEAADKHSGHGGFKASLGNVSISNSLNDPMSEIQQLRRQADSKDLIIQELKRTQRTSSKNNFNIDNGKFENKKDRKGKLKGFAENERTLNSLPVYDAESKVNKDYMPKTFAGDYSTEILEENDRLKVQVDTLQLSVDKQCVELHKSRAEAEAAVRRSHEDREEELEALRAYHHKELQNLLSDNVVQNSVGTIAELRAKLSTQDVLVQHLQEQLAQAQVNAERVSALRIREAALESQIRTITDQLQEAKNNHTPEMRHFENLQNKIAAMERKHEQREQELQQVIRNVHQSASVEIDQESQKWKQMIDIKNYEIDKFRGELDSILEVLRLLQKQGVVLPLGAPGR